MVPSQLQIELNFSQVNEFEEFVYGHRGIDSFQNISNIFFLNLASQSLVEYSAFLRGMKEIFGIKNLKEIILCQGKCSNGTKCLNHAQKEGYCWKHVS